MEDVIIVGGGPVGFTTPGLAEAGDLRPPYEPCYADGPILQRQRTSWQSQTISKQGSNGSWQESRGSMKSSSAGALAQESRSPARKLSRAVMLRVRRELPPKVRAEAPSHGRFAPFHPPGGALERLSVCGFRDQSHFPAPGRELAYCTLGSWSFGLRALALTELLSRM
jgi:hypothetical protein